MHSIKAIKIKYFTSKIDVLIVLVHWARSTGISVIVGAVVSSCVTFAAIRWAGIVCGIVDMRMKETPSPGCLSEKSSNLPKVPVQVTRILFPNKIHNILKPNNLFINKIID